MNQAKTIYVYFDHRSAGAPPILLGTLTVQQVRGREIFSFEFCPDWLKKHPGQPLDPDLQLYTGKQYTSKPNFGLFIDSAPDRWGRRLMQRKEALRARLEGVKPNVLTESDYLLGVHDETRMGALRFKTSPGGEFLNNDAAMAAPPWARLRELEEASRHLAADGPDSEREKWLAMLLAPGSSLGGARPKACVTAPDGSLWIAKFPGRGDAADVPGWEYATMRMARDAGLNVPDCSLERFSRQGSTFLVRRFDRDGADRIHFASAMTLLGRTDGTDAGQGESYLELAEFIMRCGAKPDTDLRELWRRIVFSIAVSNTDDHLRNHGFLLTQRGWELSPAYDINPNPEGQGLSLNISDTDNSLDFELAMDVAPLFRVGESDALVIRKKVSSVVARWRKYASGAGIGHTEQDVMATAFRAAQ